MLNRFLSKKDFPIRKFLNELEKRELLFLLFLSSHEREEDVDFIYQQTDDIEHFFRTIQKTVGTKMKKLPKDELINQIATHYENSELTTYVYRNIYQHSFDSDLIVFNSKLIALERFTSMVFSRKIENIQKEYFAGKLVKKHNTFEEFQKRILHLNKPILNTLGITSLLGKIDYVLQNYTDNPMAYEVKESLLCLLMEEFKKIEQDSIEQLEITLRKQDFLLKRKEQEIQKKDESLSKVKVQNRQLVIDYKELKKEIDKNKLKKKEEIDQELVKKLYKDIETKDKQLEQQTKDFKKANEKINSQYEKQIGKLELDLETIKGQDKEKMMELKQIKQKLICLETKTIETHIKEYIEREGFTEYLYQYLEPLIDEYVKQKEAPIPVEEAVLEETKKEQKVGYCIIENDNHYAVFPDGSRIQIHDIPENIYLGQWQFVKVDDDGTFKWSYGYKYDEHERDYLIHDFGSVIYKNGEAFLMKAVWDERKIENIPSYVNLKENQVISVTGKGELLRFYRSLRYNIDHCMPSIKAKGQEAYYVLKLFPNGMLLRNIETDTEEFKVLELNGHEVKEQQTLCVKENQIMHLFTSAKFYTFSNLYKKAEHGVAEWKNDMVFVRKLSGEVVIVSEIPERITIEDGDIITIDEFNNFMKIKKGHASLEETDERRKLQSKSNSPKKNFMEIIEVDKEVLVIGQITYENSYKMSLLKKGYRAEVVEGYEPWTRVNSALKGKDVVVVVTEYISHDNMWRLKEKGISVPVIFSEFDGANRIVEQVEELLDKQKAM